MLVKLRTHPHDHVVIAFPGTPPANELAITIRTEGRQGRDMNNLKRPLVMSHAHPADRGLYVEITVSKSVTQMSKAKKSIQSHHLEQSVPNSEQKGSQLTINTVLH